MAANEILDSLKLENISTDPSSILLKITREFTMAKSAKMTAPGLTACVATTLYGVGLCQELAQRFILEYCLNYGKQNVGLVFLADSGKGNHVFAFIGTPNIPEDIYIGRGTSVPAISKNKNYMLQNFIDANPDIIFVDPLLKFVGTSSTLTPLLAYCEEHAITHVSGVRDYSTTVGLVENATLIKENALNIARSLQLKPVSQQQTSVSHAGIFSEKFREKFAEQLEKQPFGPYKDYFRFGPK